MADASQAGEDHVLAVDLGTGGPKVALVSLRGRVAAATHRPNEVLLLPDGGAEQDPDDWWQAIVAGAREVLATGVVLPNQVVAVSVTSQWMGLVAVDRSGTALGNAISWMDSRGARYVDEVVGGGVELPGTGYNARRALAWLRTTGGLPSRTGKDPVGHLLWLRHADPERYAEAATVLDVPDYLNLRLTGRACAAYDTAVGFWATDNRDLGAVRWVDELVALGGLDRSKLPELVPTGSVVGPLTEGAATELGLPAGLPVVTATGDTCSAAIGSGAVRDHEAHLYVGTSSWLSCHVPYKKTDVFANITSLPSGVPGRYWVATEQDVAGKALTWLIENVLCPDDAFNAFADGVPDDVYDRMFALAADVPAGSRRVLFTPWLNGERTPVDDHHIRGGWFNVDLATDRGVLVRSVLEGVALNTRWMLGAVERFVHRHVPDGFDAITFVGGGARAPLTCQIMADVLDRPIRQATDPVMANVRGAAFSAAVALGRLRWEQVPDLVEIDATYHPDPAHRRTYDELFDTFTALYKANKGVYAKLNRALYERTGAAR